MGIMEKNMENTILGHIGYNGVIEGSLCGRRSAWQAFVKYDVDDLGL